MVMKTRYTVIGGEVVSELRSGVKRDYVSDPLGSIVSLLDNTQSVTDAFQYWPYGESATRTGTTATPFQFIGSYGYYKDGASRSYIRARYLDMTKGRWITEDDIQFLSGDINFYRYVYNNSISLTDKYGYQSEPYPVIVPYPAVTPSLGLLVDDDCVCYGGLCAYQMTRSWYPLPQHHCNPCYAHCMACCTLSRYMGDGGDCAYRLQELQNRTGDPKHQQWPGGPTREERRWTGCSNGLRVARNPSKTCHQGCSEAFRWDNYPPTKNICRLDSKCAGQYKDHGWNPGRDGLGIPGFPPLILCGNTV